MAVVYFAVLLLSCFAADYVRAGMCTEDDLKKCTNGGGIAAFANIDATSESDIRMLCGAMKCIQTMTCDLPDSLQALGPMMEQMSGLCPKGDGSGAPTCDILGLQKCGLKDMGAKEPTPEDIKALCPSQKCLADLLPSCENADLKMMVQSAVDSMAKLCMPGCQAAEAFQCFEGLNMDAINGIDAMNQETCNKMETASECAGPLMKNCEGEVAQGIQNMTSFAKCCSKIVTVKDKCIMSDEDPEKIFGATDISSCKRKEDLYSCVMTGDLKCSGPVAALIDGIKMQGKKAVTDCENQGYNITISLETGKTLNDNGMGIALHPSASVVFGLLLAVLAWRF